MNLPIMTLEPIINIFDGLFGYHSEKKYITRWMTFVEENCYVDTVTLNISANSKYSSPLNHHVYSTNRTYEIR